MAIVDKIRALLAKTAANGCTEAEAMAAADKARELMDQYQIDLGELGMKTEGIEKLFAARGSFKKLNLRDMLALGVARFCDCRAWTHNESIIFFGLTSDTQFAQWLLDSLDYFIRQKAGEFMMDRYVESLNTAVVPRWDNEKAFILGCKDRINERLNAAVRDRKRQAMGDGRSLVVVKEGMVNQAFADLGLRLRRNSSAAVRFNDRSAYSAGAAAGDGASFGRPVSGAGATLRIGKGDHNV